MSFVLDACTMIAFLRDEPGAEVVESFLTNEICMAHAINMCELYYDFYRASDEQTAEQAVHDLLSLGLILHNDMDKSIWQDAGKMKAEIKRISIADCFAIALTRKTGSSIVTSDHHEFDPLVDKNICRIVFIR